MKTAVDYEAPVPFIGRRRDERWYHRGQTVDAK
jgi:hypothetical protein